jgi:dipeptidyl aminopeptidase/acylaminoacyl peptidase
MEMGNFDDEDYFRSISPIFHAANIVRPLLVIQGENDPRVLQVESDEIVAAVRENDVPVEYVVFDDEGHGFAKKENEAVAYRSVVEFLDTHL